jgi:hypothetical protein
MEIPNDDNFAVAIEQSTLSLEIKGDQLWYLEQAVHMFSGEGEDAKSLSIKMRFLAIEVTTEKEAHDEFELTVMSSE